MWIDIANKFVNLDAVTAIYFKKNDKRNEPVISFQFKSNAAQKHFFLQEAADFLDYVEVLRKKLNVTPFDEPLDSKNIDWLEIKYDFIDFVWLRTDSLRLVLPVLPEKLERDGKTDTDDKYFIYIDEKNSYRHALDFAKETDYKAAIKRLVRALNIIKQEE